MGGFDLCFGRWDTSEHVLVDDNPSGFKEGSVGDPQVWPGKDYSNPRVQDFFKLDKPYEDLHDRSQIPRMPWHDVSMQCTGQLARDMARHFVQRWNYLLRTKPPAKPTPILLPPPDLTLAELENLKLNGTCEVQLLRSCGQWSMGLRDKTEHSIQNAYIECIEQSEHFVYIENQFFITECECDGIKIENKIGGAIVNRIIRAHKEGTNWRAIIILPLMPGFPHPIDSPDASCLRVIMRMQYHSLCRGETSIFGRLRQAGIDPGEYISVYGLRGWGKIGDQDKLVTEQVYIHAKIMIVDDRVAIIGSANINERSMRGHRDSEIAAIVRDTEQYEVPMAGKPFMVGKFAHTLRMRLQLEHLGVNTDDFEHRAPIVDGLAPGNSESTASQDLAESNHIPNGYRPYSFNHDNSRLDEENYHIMDNVSHEYEAENKLYSPNEPQPTHIRTDFLQSSKRPRSGRPSVATSPNLDKNIIQSSIQSQTSKVNRAERLKQENRDAETITRSNTPNTTADDTLCTNQAEHSSHQLASPRHLIHHGDGWSILQPPPRTSRVTGCPIPTVDPYNAFDPLDNSFFHNQWNAVAQHNTIVYRHVFFPMPDNDVKTWSEYKELSAFGERLAKACTGEDGKAGALKGQPEAWSPVSVFGGSKLPSGVGSKGAAGLDDTQEIVEGGDGAGQEKEHIKQDSKNGNGELTHRTSKSKAGVKHEENELMDGRIHSEHAVKGTIHETNGSLEQSTSRSSEHSTQKRRRGKSNANRAEQFNMLPKDTMEELLSEVQGHLVEWPTDWLAKEDTNGSFLHSFDR